MSDRERSDPIRPWSQEREAAAARLLLAIRAAARRRLGSSDLDLVDEITSEALQRSLMRYPPEEIRNPATWADRMVRDSWVEYLRSHKRESDALKELALEACEDYATVERDREAEEEPRSISRAIGKLPTAQQEVIVLHYFGEMSFESIAAYMHKDCNAVYQLHFKALNNLQSRLKEPELCHGDSDDD